MRQFFSIVILLSVFSCAENRHASTVFNQAESIMSTAPDSALALIRSIDEHSISTIALRARHALLLTIAQDRCYIDVEEEKITPYTSIINDLGADSLDVVDLLMSIEDEFEVEVPDDEIENIKTVEDLVKYIENNQ